ncbi:MAG: DivIVA domain-containing protein [Oscillospiraceae bacterium]|nr:DivIVA domain-containing protein [Oscillospiraceae bacterium]
MFTPQQIDQISFGKATFGGYNMEDVDSFLEPLTEDYVTLYKENALLKSKMRVLVGKLEEYRKNEAAMKDAIVNAQKTCDKMVREAEAKCAKMLSEANTAASQNTVNAGALVAAEQARVQEARKLAATKIDEIQEQMRTCIQALERVKQANQPKTAPAAAPAPVAKPAEPAEPAVSTADAVADEISQNLEALVGTTVDTAPKAEPRHPVNDSTTAKFANLQFGRNYDPNHK